METAKLTYAELENQIAELKKQIELKLVSAKENEQKFRLIAENTTDGILVLGADTKIQYVSPAYLKQIGYTEQEELARDSEAIYAILHPEDRDTTFANIFDAIKQKKEELTYSFRVKHKKGHYFWREDHAKFNYDSNKNHINTYVICRDISQRKQIEQEVLESEEKYRILFERNTSIILILDPHTGQILDANASALEFYGYERNKIQEMNMSEINVLSKKELLNKMQDAVLEKRNHFHFIHRKASGVKRDVEVYSTPIKIKGKEILFSIIHDITERKEAEFTLRESENNMRALFNAMEDVVFEMDYNGRYIFIAPTSAEHMAKQPEEVLGKTMHEVFPKVEADFYLEFVRKCLDENKMNTIEYPMTIDNRNFWYEGRAVPNTKNTVLFIGRDITERKQAEDALVESADKYSSIIETAMDGFWLVDLQGRFLQVNERYCEMSGYTEQELLTMQISDIESFETADDTAAHIKKLLIEGEDRFETKHRRKDGSTFDLDVSVQYKNYKGGQLVCFLHDITERKQAEEKLSENEARLRAISENTSDLIALSDNTGVITYASSAAKEIFLLSPKEMCGRNFIEFVDDPEIPRALSLFQDTVEKGKALGNMEFSMKRKDGSVFIGELSGAKFQQANTIGMLVTIRDITERKQAEEELKLLTARLSLAARAGGVGIWDHDLVNDILLWDDQMYALYGVNKNDFSGVYDAWSSGIHPDDIERAEAEVEMAIKDEKEFDTEFRTVWADGSIHTIRALANVQRNADGKPLRMIGTNWDITDQKNTEQELIGAKEKAEESDRLKSAFLANMSHEIRTPMNGILGFAELLKEPDLTGDMLQEYINVIEKSGARMLNIINEIVDISKIEAGLMKTDIRELNINNQMDYVYSFFKPQVKAKKLEFFVKNSVADKEAVFFTDPEKVNAVLFNLVKNAIKYTDDGSIEFGCNKKENHIEFYVKDTGIGIHKDRQDAIFERFVQADIKDLQARQGAGLGLSISKAYIEMLGGKIGVDSEPGKGSSFYFNLPLNAHETQAMEVEKDPIPLTQENPVNKIKILIAEDDEASEMFMTIVLRPFSKEMLKARTGKDAIEICRNNPDIDLVMMDIQMPDINGYEATQQIRQFNKNVVIIAQTAFGLSGDREKSIEAGCNDYISKPIKKDKIMTVIQKYFKI